MSKESKRIQDEVNQLLFDATEDLKRALKNHAYRHDANDLLPQFTAMCEKVKELESRQDLTRDHVKALEKYQQQVNASENIERICKRLNDLEKEIKGQRDDYHTHIRQLVTENEAAHSQIKKTEDVARECSNKQAAEITRLMNRVRDQSDYILELKKRVMAIEDKNSTIIKDCASCKHCKKYYDEFPCNDCAKATGKDPAHWEPRKAGRPKKTR